MFYITHLDKDFLIIFYLGNIIANPIYIIF